LSLPRHLDLASGSYKVHLPSFPEFPDWFVHHFELPTLLFHLWACWGVDMTLNPGILSCSCNFSPWWTLLFDKKIHVDFLLEAMWSSKMTFSTKRTYCWHVTCIWRLSTSCSSSQASSQVDATLFKLFRWSGVSP
jgi:hypothetical protein